MTTTLPLYTSHQWLQLIYDASFHPAFVYHSEVHWLVASASSVAEYVSLCARKARQCGFLLFPLPVLAQGKMVRKVPLMARVVLEIPPELVEGAAYEAVLAAFGFVRDATLMGKIHVHRSGNSQISVVDAARLAWSRNPLITNGSASSLLAALKAIFPVEATSSGGGAAAAGGAVGGGVAGEVEPGSARNAFTGDFLGDIAARAGGGGSGDDSDSDFYDFGRTGKTPRIYFPGFSYEYSTDEEGDHDGAHPDEDGEDRRHHRGGADRGDGSESESSGSSPGVPIPWTVSQSESTQSVATAGQGSGGQGGAGGVPVSPAAPYFPLAATSVAAGQVALYLVTARPRRRGADGMPI